MKVYFVDGMVRQANVPKDENYYVVDACQGYSQCVLSLEEIMQHRPDSAVLTNFVGATSPDVCFNKSTNKFDLFFEGNDGQWHNVHELTDKDIRYAHNIEKMYKAGSFEDVMSHTESLFET